MVCEKQTLKKRENEGENESCEMSQEDQFKANVFLPLIDHAICCLIDRFEQMHTVSAVFDFLYNQENLLREYQHNPLPSVCQNLYKAMRDIDPLKINNELDRFVVIARKHKSFLTNINKKQLLKVHLNVRVALPVLLTCLAVSVGGAERSFNKLKLIKIIRRFTVIDKRHYVISMISIERACVRDLDLYHIVNMFAAEKVCRKTF